MRIFIRATMLCQMLGMQLIGSRLSLSAVQQLPGGTLMTMHSIAPGSAIATWYQCDSACAKGICMASVAQHQQGNMSLDRHCRGCNARGM